MFKTNVRFLCFSVFTACSAMSVSAVTYAAVKPLPDIAYPAYYTGQTKSGPVFGWGNENRVVDNHYGSISVELESNNTSDSEAVFSKLKTALNNDARIDSFITGSQKYQFTYPFTGGNDTADKIFFRTIFPDGGVYHEPDGAPLEVPKLKKNLYAIFNLNDISIPKDITIGNNDDESTVTPKSLTLNVRVTSGNIGVSFNGDQFEGTLHLVKVESEDGRKVSNLTDVTSVEIYNNKIGGGSSIYQLKFDYAKVTGQPEASTIDFVGAGNYRLVYIYKADKTPEANAFALSIAPVNNEGQVTPGGITPDYDTDDVIHSVPWSDIVEPPEKDQPRVALYVNNRCSVGGLATFGYFRGGSLIPDTVLAGLTFGAQYRGVLPNSFSPARRSDKFGIYKNGPNGNLETISTVYLSGWAGIGHQVPYFYHDENEQSPNNPVKTWPKFAFTSAAWWGKGTPGALGSNADKIRTIVITTDQTKEEATTHGTSSGVIGNGRCSTTRLDAYTQYVNPETLNNNSGFAGVTKPISRAGEINYTDLDLFGKRYGAMN